MAIVAGVDFGTLSARVTLLDSERGRLGTASADVSAAPAKGGPGFLRRSRMTTR